MSVEEEKLDRINNEDMNYDREDENMRITSRKNLEWECNNYN